MPSAKTRIGWREWARFPELGVDKINAKIDTGAKSSAIHAFDIKETKIDGEVYVEFRLRADDNRAIACCERVCEERDIRSSNGQSERRYVIQTELYLGEASCNIDLTLTNRDAMEHPLLLGRDALRGKFIVDPSAEYLLGD